MTAEGTALPALDLPGTFAFALDGALTALRVARLDVVGVVGLGTTTAIGSGTLRDVLVGQIRTVGAAVLCSGIRMVGVHHDLDAPMPPRAFDDPGPDDD